MAENCKKGSPIWWRFYNRTFKDKIQSFFNYIKWSFQRVNHGYAEVDTWDIDMWFVAVMPDMLRDLKNDHHGSPVIIEEDGSIHDMTDEEWCDTLEHMAFLCGELSDDTRVKQNPIDYEEVMADPSLRDEWLAEEKKIDSYVEDCKNEFFKLFNKYFFYLWD